MKVPLWRLAAARSGDKGSSANIGVLAKRKEYYPALVRLLTESVVFDYFRPSGPTKVDRYLIPNLDAMNFVLTDVLAGGGSRSLRIDSQGKALGQALLLMQVELTDAEAALLK
jgi:hypothetical protein